jgi:hypothetical protein
MFRYNCIDILVGKQQDLPEVDIGYCSYLYVLRIMLPFILQWNVLIFLLTY